MMNRGILNPMNKQIIKSGGIYHNRALGLISVSADGEEWVTMADKNLGATTVYNDGDTLSEANCGKYYQWGNNYGFPFTGPATTSSTQVDASNYGPYYSDDTFRYGGPNGRWFTPGNYNLWGDEANTNEARRGPCPEGFHIMTYRECGNIVDLAYYAGLSGDQISNFLKIPYAGCRASNADINNLHFQAYIISTNCRSGAAGGPNGLGVSSSGTSMMSWGRRPTGNIRPAKNEIAIPDETWTTVWEGDEYEGTYYSGIYYKSDLGLITIKRNGNYFVTITDKNLGATKVYNFGDTLTNANCGNYYQRGNCYGFPGPETSSSEIKKSTEVANVANYGPYYYGDTFITGEDWSSPSNRNLRGRGVSRAEPNYYNMQGPCPEGFYVGGLEKILYAVGPLFNTQRDMIAGIKKYLKIPFAGYIDSNSGSIIDKGSVGIYWNADALSGSISCGTRLEDYITYIYTQNRTRGCSIRPIKIEPVIPDSSWERLYPEMPETDYFEADIDTIDPAGQGINVIMPPLLGLYLTGLTEGQADGVVFPQIDVRLYVDDALIGHIQAPQVYVNPDSAEDLYEKLQERINIILPYIANLTYQEAGTHRIKIVPAGEKGGWARGLGYAILYITGEGGIVPAIPVVLRKQPSNEGYLLLGGIVGEGFKFGQFIGMVIKNEVEVEPIPSNRFSNSKAAFFAQFTNSIVPRVTITAQNGENPPDFWRNQCFWGDVFQLVIKGNQMDANVSGEGNRWDELEGFVGDDGLHIYVAPSLVDSYKALNQNIAPYVFSNQNIPNPPEIKNPGVYYNESLGLISFSGDGVNWLTMMDKNLGASSVYHDGDEVSAANCGNFYQRGNIYGFSYGGPQYTSNVAVSTSGYGPGNYYSSDTFITRVPWTSGQYNLWGGMDDTFAARQGPCPAGYHIPSYVELSRLAHWYGNRSDFRNIFLAPLSGFFNNGGTHREINQTSGFWTSDSNSYGKGYSVLIYRTGTSGTTVSDHFNINIGLPIRPFKNTPVIPNSTWTKLA